MLSWSITLRSKPPRWWASGKGYRSIRKSTGSCYALRNRCLVSLELNRHGYSPRSPHCLRRQLLPIFVVSVRFMLWFSLLYPRYRPNGVILAGSLRDHIHNGGKSGHQHDEFPVSTCRLWLYAVPEHQFKTAVDTAWPEMVKHRITDRCSQLAKQPILCTPRRQGLWKTGTWSFFQLNAPYCGLIRDDCAAFLVMRTSL